MVMSIKYKNIQTVRLKNSNKMQLHVDIYVLLNYCTCFGRPSRPSSGVHKTVVTASGAEHTVWGASFFRRDQIRTAVLIWSRLKKDCSPYLFTFEEGLQSLFGHV